MGCVTITTILLVFRMTMRVRKFLMNFCYCSICRHCCCTNFFPDNSIRYGRLLLNLFRGSECLTSNNKPFKFDADPNHDPNPRFLSRILTVARKEQLIDFCGICCRGEDLQPFYVIGSGLGLGCVRRQHVRCVLRLRCGRLVPFNTGCILPCFRLLVIKSFVFG